jgi:hypothetical protein
MPFAREWSLGDAIPEMDSTNASRSRSNLSFFFALSKLSPLRGFEITRNKAAICDGFVDNAFIAAAFREALQPLGQPIVRRYSGGKDVNAGCGMLAAMRTAVRIRW